MLKKLLAVPVLAATLIGGAGAIAATAAPAAAQYLPPGYYANRQAAVQGVVTSFYGFNMTLQARSGAIVPVQLHQGTILVPLGLSLAPGMPVIVRGYWWNGAFFANRIRLL